MTNYHQDNWSNLLSMAKFSYNNMMHSTTQQTPFFTNHGLHPRFDIQGVNNVMNLTVEDQAMWLVNIRT
jgi:gluconate kinase